MCMFVCIFVREAVQENLVRDKKKCVKALACEYLVILFFASLNTNITAQAGKQSVPIYYLMLSVSCCSRWCV